MNRRYAMMGAVGLLAIVCIILLWSASERQARSQEDRPRIGLLSSLPLEFGEGSLAERVQGKNEPAAAYSLLSDRFRIEPIDSLDDLAESDPDALFLVQPRALMPQELVELDDWLRKGGAALILADPALKWPSEYPIGDSRRPLFTSLLSPLFDHWGIELVLPMDDPSSSTEARVGGKTVDTAVPGAFQPLDPDEDAIADCMIDDSELLADCRVGEGRALLFADADLLHERFWRNSGPWSFVDDSASDNMELVIGWLDDLSGRKAHETKR